MHILITNDDGIFSPGLLALAMKMRAFGTVSVIAPEKNWSASGHVRTLDRPLRVNEVNLAENISAWSCDGAPSDCIALGLRGFLDDSVDLVVTGINAGANLGEDITYSGTVSAAMEAVVWQTPAVAFSLEIVGTQLPDYDAAAFFADQIIEIVLQNVLTPSTLLNVNIPCLPVEQIRGIQLTRQGKRFYHDRVLKRLDPRGKPYYWVVGEAPTGNADPHTDVGALASGYVSVTPIQLDLTANEYMEAMKYWGWKFNGDVSLPDSMPLLMYGVM